MAAAAAAQSKSMASMAKRFCSKTCNICVGTGKGQGGMAKTCKGDRSKKCQTSSKVTAHSCARLGEENVHKEAATGPGDGGGGGGGGDGGWNCTTKDLIPCWGCLGMGPSAKEKLFPKLGASHFAPFQPSPYESVMSRVHVAPSATANGTLEVYGAPPLSVVPSEQARLQPTSLAPDPLEQVIVKKIVGVGGDGGGASGGGDKDRESLQTATSSSTR